MNPHAAQPASLAAMLKKPMGQSRTDCPDDPARSRWALQGSVMGLLWSFLNPLFMLVVYSFVFSVVFKARWSGGGESQTQFAVILFAE